MYIIALILVILSCFGVGNIHTTKKIYREVPQVPASDIDLKGIFNDRID